MENRHIIVFDGICNFCNGAVNFIIKRDKIGLFVFSPLQSDHAIRILTKYKIVKSDSDTILLIKNESCYVRTDAILEIAKDLSGLWFLFGIFKILPVRFRDLFYRFFARNRYQFFGKRESCMVPTPEIRNRFIDW